MTTTNTPAPDAGHAAEPIAAMSNERLLTAYYRSGIRFALTDDMHELGEVNSRAADIHAELMNRLNATPDAGTGAGRE